MRPPNLDDLIDLYPWKPSLALFRAVEWRGVHRHAARVSEPILDLGCGDGQIARMFLGARRVIGLDRAHGPLAAARRHIGPVVQGDARSLPFRDGQFGTYFGNCAVEHLPELDTCLVEASRVLRPGGTFIATVPSAHWKSLYVWNRLFSALGFHRLGRRIVDAHDRRMAHHNLLASEEWRRRFQKAGLEPIAFDPYLSPRGARFTTLVESILARPFPCPGFLTESGTYYFISGVLRRVGGEQFWKGVFHRLLMPLYEESIGPDGVSAGTVLVARKLGA